MAAFTNINLTYAGLVLLSRAQAGEQLKFTHFTIGDGNVPALQDPKALNDVINPVLSVTVTRLNVDSPGEITVSGDFENEDMDEEFYYRELGLFAEDPDNPTGDNILYAYGNAGENAEYIPLVSAQVVNKNIQLKIAIGDAPNVTINIATGIYALDAEVYKKGETYSREEVNQKMATVYNPKGSKDSFSELPTDATVNDVYNILQSGGLDEQGHPILAGDNVVKTENGWDKLGGFVDLSGYSLRVDTDIAPSVEAYANSIMDDFNPNSVLYPPATSVTIGNYLSQSGGNISFTVIVPSGYYTDQGIGTFDCAKKGSMAITAAGKSTGNISSNGVKTLS